MPVLCDDLKKLLTEVSLMRDCDILSDGTVRISTPFQYPNGTFIDVFLQDGRTLPETKKALQREYLLSDCGQTATYLLDLHIKSWATQKRRKLVSDVCEALEVQERRGELMVDIEPGQLDSLGEVVIRLAQACIRVADLSLTQRFPITGVFRDEVEEFIDQANLNYEPDFVLPGRFNREVAVDFRVVGQRTSLLKTISPATPESAHQQMNEALSKWMSLSNYRPKNQLLTVIEDKKGNIYRDDDLLKVAELCDGVILFPSERLRLREALQSA
jgi:hypothetical protein